MSFIEEFKNETVMSGPGNEFLHKLNELVWTVNKILEYHPDIENYLREERAVLRARGLL